jgi:hypothetical protein
MNIEFDSTSKNSGIGIPFFSIPDVIVPLLYMTAVPRVLNVFPSFDENRPALAKCGKKIIEIMNERL